jgi:hypothetical protein
MRRLTSNAGVEAPGGYEEIVGLEELRSAPEERGALPLRRREFARGLRQAALGVPDDVGLDQVAVRLEQEFPVDDIMLGAEHQECLANTTQIGSRFLDDGTKVLEPADGLGTDLSCLPIDQYLAAEGRREGNALRHHRARDGLGERPARRLEGERITGAQACHGVEKQCRVGHCTRHWPLHRQRCEKIVGRAARDAAGRWPQAHHRAVGSRSAEASGVI